VTGSCVAAIAADMPMKAPLVAPPVYDWTDLYIEGLGGYAFGNHNLNNALGPAGFANFTANWQSPGPFGGGEFGGNWQTGWFVFGFGADGVWLTAPTTTPRLDSATRSIRTR
jgi:outer membrane immunogenic protein